MQSLARNLFHTAVLTGVFIGGIAAAPAQDVAKVNPASIKVTLDNTRVRVMEATLKPGVQERMHHHPASIVYVVAGGKVRSHGEDGSVSEATYQEGQMNHPGFVGEPLV